MTTSNCTLAMGPTFSQWERLTDEYRQGLEALRSGDTRGSQYMMRLAREIQMLGSRCSDTRDTRDTRDTGEPTDWSASEMEALSAASARPNVGQRFARMFSMHA